MNSTMMGGLRDMANIFGMEDSNLEYQPRVAPHFHPDRIILTKGCNQAGQQRESIEAICNIYPDAQVIDNSDLPHNRIEFATAGSLSTHYAGKKTLVFGVHKSALRFSGEDGNTCPNYWHFSPYGFCPYDCQYCYLAGTPGVRFSPTVKIFLNLPQILERISVVATKSPVCITTNLPINLPKENMTEKPGFAPINRGYAAAVFIR